MPILQAHQLKKLYGKQTVLKEVDFSISGGEIVGLVGRNGSGKTTLMKMILGLTSRTAGQLEIDDQVRFGYLLDCKMFEYLTAYENLHLFAQYNQEEEEGREDRLLWLLEFVGLKKDKKLVKSYSFGMKQRLGLALALLEKPNFLILDEPFVGLDPLGTKKLQDYIQKIRDEFQITVLISSHQLEEIEAICDYFLVLDQGKITRSDVLRHSQLYLRLAEVTPQQKEALKAYPFEDDQTIVIENEPDLYNALFKDLVQNQVTISRLEERRDAQGIFRK